MPRRNAGASSGNRRSSRITNGGFELALARQHVADHVVLHEHLHPLGDPRREFAAFLHGCSMRRRDRAGAQRLRQDVGGGDRVLHREIDADAADRRHGMRGVADAEQPGSMPALAAGRPPRSAA